MKIALDASAEEGAGGCVDAAVTVVTELGLEVCLVGRSELLRSELSKRKIAPNDPRFEVLAAAGKPDSAVMAACELAAAKKAHAVVSTSPPAAVLQAAVWHLKRLPGVLKPALAAPVPTRRGPAVLVDAGANADSKAWHLLQFAAMGSVYARLILGRDRPKIALLSGGEAAAPELVKEAVPLLKASGLNFTGPMDAAKLPEGEAEVVVCDGFVGDVCLRLLRAACAAASAELEGSVGRLRKPLLRKPMERLRRAWTLEEHGGTPLLGVDGAVVACAPDAGTEALANALRTAKRLVETSHADVIRKSVDEVKQNLETSKVNF